MVANVFSRRPSKLGGASAGIMYSRRPPRFGVSAAIAGKPSERRMVIAAIDHRRIRSSSAATLPVALVARGRFTPVHASASVLESEQRLCVVVEDLVGIGFG